VISEIIFEDEKAPVNATQTQTVSLNLELYFLKGSYLWVKFRTLLSELLIILILFLLEQIFP